MEFQIPLSREDLLRREGSHYAVPDCCTSGELVTRLEECRATLDGGRLQSITECFPVFYCLMRNFLRVGKSLREAYWRIAAKALEGACHQVGGVNIGGMNQSRKSEMRNCLKMMVYVIVQLVEEFENEATKPDSLDMASGPKRGRKKKGATAAGSESHSSGLDWGQERERVVEVMCDLVECDLWLLWEPPSAQMMEDFSNLLLSLCYKLLENPGFVREKNARQKVIFLVGTLIKRYSMGLSVGMKVPQLLQHFEHLVSPLAQALQCWAQEFGAKSVVAEVVRELGRKDPRDLSHDASGTRSFATFLVELSQYVPAAILPSISVLLPHLGGESYTMRNGVLGVIGETISQVLSSPQLDNQTKLTRDKLLDRLQQHLHDVNAFVRSKCLQIWLQLCNAKAIPLPRLKAVLPLVVGRTQDKSSNVRKNAVQLLTGLMAANPFAAKMILPVANYRNTACPNMLTSAQRCLDL